ncbi:MAG: TrkH family potassium uptake protein [Intestinibacter sp.]|uniref:TrkH family potassium uptake protein n=1 Tax=Intestinibacter sp. TaxID=1965304 RepID=UPI003F17996F
MEFVINKLSKISSMKKILAGYCILILIGTFFLMLPEATRLSQRTSFLDAFFTATSATCVTGLIRFDTYTYWSLFGQIVILSLIQIGGIGFMTFAISIISFTGAKIGIRSRCVMQESIAAPQMGGIVKMTKFIFFGSIILEFTGAFLLSFYFCPKLGFLKGIYFSIFHSISAFCNAGFDLMGNFEQFSSLTSVYDNWYLNLIIMLLIIIGGLGFFVWKDLIDCKFKFNKLRLHTKIVVCVTLLLIIFGTIVLFIFEYNNTTFEGKSLSQKILMSLFQSTTTRTAGFNTMPLNEMRESSLFFMICLMLVGGSSGSTAGGIKTTTFAILTLSIIATFRRKKEVECFGRRMEEDVLQNASCIFMTYIILCIISSMIISNIENISMITSLFECISAIATVGLTIGITPELGCVSEFILSILMLFGRVGSITILLAFSSEKKIKVSKLPHEKIKMG